MGVQLLQYPRPIGVAVDDAAGAVVQVSVVTYLLEIEAAVLRSDDRARSGIENERWLAVVVFVLNVLDRLAWKRLNKPGSIASYWRIAATIFLNCSL